MSALQKFGSKREQLRSLGVLLRGAPCVQRRGAASAARLHGGMRSGAKSSSRRRAVIVALVNQKGGVGRTTLALHLAGHWAKRRQRVVVIDADPQASAVAWAERRAEEGLRRRFGVVRLARTTLHRETHEIARDFDRVVIDAPPRIATLMCSALRSADLVLVPTQLAPFDIWAQNDALRLIDDARASCPRLVVRLVLNRCHAAGLIAAKARQALAEHDLLPLETHVSQRIAFADAARTGRLVTEVPHGAPAAAEIAALAAEIERVAR